MLDTSGLKRSPDHNLLMARPRVSGEIAPRYYETRLVLNYWLPHQMSTQRSGLLRTHSRSRRKDNQREALGFTDSHLFIIFCDGRFPLGVFFLLAQQSSWRVPSATVQSPRSSFDKSRASPSIFVSGSGGPSPKNRKPIYHSHPAHS